FRYYDPLAVQYVSPDPIGLAGGMRSPGYVFNPSKFVDPLGLAVLYRSMSEAEYAGILKTGNWSTAGTMEGKWFATTYDDAVKWGSDMGHGSDKFVVAQVTVPDRVAQNAFSTKSLDNIGPAKYVDIDTLNRSNSRITWTRTICCK
ncbi:RHS repeat-associated core domain-containing protein, partial [Methylobacterium indicum]|uniref:RHS repeat-associated core domain-containing protein n=1 Tax=Methylobacterium indicum TaxID=1775910 RepID=UPI001930FBEE